jgi:hypothetical protein
VLVLGFVAELAPCLWLLVMGVNEAKWRERAQGCVLKEGRR